MPPPDDTGPGPTGPAPRRRRLPSAERRQEFIAKAIDFFAEEGFESSTRGLAKRLGVTQPLLYRYFPSKEDLISEVYDVVYVNRWRPEWADIIADRERPLRDRLNHFYQVYTEVIFNRQWMRIYLFSGLKGADINRRYMLLVRQRILEPVVAEARAEFGAPPRPATDQEVEFAWTIHGGIFYYGVRDLVYESTLSTDKATVIEDAVDALLSVFQSRFSPN
ncbi:TetR/AcrR family transcriptional regulator [Roseisalinus antarcticus]|uniref:Bacterial regulatory proteins, tetR family n=1 Tax=Roseisalinus antarcticus TaxID=254357 RepID=A0A1Y5TYT9_9RHOB|nr:TetR/AcrR family transcriptional regulator [Roseisalinus antarcticus]SLN76763.1 Bacterial regulatory proteins, tetR family [Roseisalinus antarcticus]